jgi:hypothetical protein
MRFRVDDKGAARRAIGKPGERVAIVEQAHLANAGS